jgi:FAD/FMN-containing dehydrogenase
VNDIVESLKFAAENCLKTAIMGAGHQVVGVQLLPNGLTIDTSNLTAIEVDPDTETAYVQAGILHSKYGFPYSTALPAQAAIDCVVTS